MQDTDADGEQDEQGDAAQDIDEPGLSLSSDDNEDQVNGPQYLSDDKDIIEIYDDDDDSDGNLSHASGGCPPLTPLTRKSCATHI